MSKRNVKKSGKKGAKKQIEIHYYEHMSETSMKKYANQQINRRMKILPMFLQIVEKKSLICLLHSGGR